MQTTTTLGKVYEQVEKEAARCWDEVVAMPSILFRDISTLLIGSRVHPVRPVAKRSFADRLGIPLPYLERCTPDLQALNLNHRLQRCTNSTFLLRFVGDEVRAVFTDRYKPADNLLILQKLLAMGYGEQSLVQCHQDDGLMSLGIVDETASFSLGTDQHVGGLSVVNSEVGLSSLRLSWFVLRLVCTNGLIVRTRVASQYHRHVSRTLLDNLPQQIREIGQSGQHIRQHLQLSLQSKVADPDATFDQINRRFKLLAEERAATAWGWEQEPGETLFHVVNAYTRGAQAETLTAESRWRLQRVGGEIL